MISHHRPCGRWCFARLIRQAETLELQLHSQPPSKRTALSPLKRSCFRFAARTLRCRTEPALQAAPVFRSAYSASRNARTPAASRSSWEPHCAFSSKTLMLQVRFAHPPNSSRPAAAPINCTCQNLVSPPQGVSGAAVAAPDSRGGKGRVKLSPICTRPAAAPINCTLQNRVSPPRGCRGRPQPPPTGIGARGRAKPFPSLHSPGSRT